MMEQPEPGLYRHYKGAHYEVLGTASHSETLEPLVVYRGVENQALWVRPVAMFMESVTVDGKPRKRFEKVV